MLIRHVKRALSILLVIAMILPVFSIRIQAEEVQSAEQVAPKIKTISITTGGNNKREATDYSGDGSVYLISPVVNSMSDKYAITIEFKDETPLEGYSVKMVNRLNGQEIPGTVTSATYSYTTAQFQRTQYTSSVDFPNLNFGFSGVNYFDIEVSKNAGPSATYQLYMQMPVNTAAVITDMKFYASNGSRLTGSEQISPAISNSATNHKAEISSTNLIRMGIVRAATIASQNAYNDHNTYRVNGGAWKSLAANSSLSNEDPILSPVMELKKGLNVIEFVSYGMVNGRTGYFFLVNYTGEDQQPTPSPSNDTSLKGVYADNKITTNVTNSDYYVDHANGDYTLYLPKSLAAKTAVDASIRIRAYTGDSAAKLDISDSKKTIGATTADTNTLLPPNQFILKGLSESTSSVPLVVTAENGTTKSYDLKIKWSESGNTIDSITGTSKTPGDSTWDSARNLLLVPAKTSEVALTVRTAAGASLKINNQDATSGVPFQVDLSSTNTITIVVNAEDRLSSKTYTLTKYSAAEDATLSQLDIRVGAATANAVVTPSFSANTSAYNLRDNVASNISFVAIKPKVSNDQATVSYSPSALTEAELEELYDNTGYEPPAGFVVLPYRGTISVTVTAADGETKKTYSVGSQQEETTTVLNSVTLPENHVLSPAFDKRALTYTMTVSSQNLTHFAIGFVKGAAGLTVNSPQGSVRSDLNTITYDLSSKPSKLEIIVKDTVKNETTTYTINLQYPDRSGTLLSDLQVIANAGQGIQESFDGNLFEYSLKQPLYYSLMQQYQGIKEIPYNNKMELRVASPNSRARFSIVGAEASTLSKGVFEVTLNGSEPYIDVVVKESNEANALTSQYRINLNWASSTIVKNVVFYNTNQLNALQRPREYYLAKESEDFMQRGFLPGFTGEYWLNMQAQIQPANAKGHQNLYVYTDHAADRVEILYEGRTLNAIKNEAGLFYYSFGTEGTDKVPILGGDSLVTIRAYKNSNYEDARVKIINVYNQINRVNFYDRTAQASLDNTKYSSKLVTNYTSGGYSQTYSSFDVTMSNEIDSIVFEPVFGQDSSKISGYDIYVDGVQVNESVIPTLATDVGGYWIYPETSIGWYTDPITGEYKYGPMPRMIYRAAKSAPIPIPGGERTTVEIMTHRVNGSAQASDRYTYYITRGADPDGTNQNANLSEILVETDSGLFTLSPEFSSEASEYTVNIPYDTKFVKITGKTADPSASVTHYTRSYLVFGEFYTPAYDQTSTINLVSTAGDGYTQKTYRITLVREGLVRDDGTIRHADQLGTLYWLKTNAGELKYDRTDDQGNVISTATGYNPDVHEYYVDVYTAKIKKINISTRYIFKESDFSIKVNGVTSIRDPLSAWSVYNSSEINLKYGEPQRVEVATYYKGVYQYSYFITITQHNEKSDDATLSDLMFTSATNATLTGTEGRYVLGGVLGNSTVMNYAMPYLGYLNGAPVKFNADHHMYMGFVNYNITKMFVTPIAMDDTTQITMSVNGGTPVPIATKSKNTTVDLNVGQNKIVFHSVPEDATDPDDLEDYTVIIYRKPNTNIKSITMLKDGDIVGQQAGLLNPSYSAYSAIVDNGVRAFDLKIEAEDSSAKVSVSTPDGNSANGIGSVTISTTLSALASGQYVVSISNNSRPEFHYGFDGEPMNGKQYTEQEEEYLRRLLNVKESTLTIYQKPAYAPDKVTEVVPAPGQFINEHGQAVTGKLGESGWGDGWDLSRIGATELFAGKGGNSSPVISLGSFGGYITYRFDTPVKNSPHNKYGVDFIIYGNSFSGNEEPAGVQVAQDLNHDGKPDRWYTLAGSEHYEDSTDWNYTVTYTNPDPDFAEYYAKNVPWNDNIGGSSHVRANFYHTQPYYPDPANYIIDGKAQVNSSSLTASFTKIASRVPSFGYADTHSGYASDGYDKPGNPYKKQGDGFDISWAVDENGNPVHLDEVSFIRAYSATLMDAGALGEVSPEILGVARVSPETEAVGKTPDLSELSIGGKRLVLEPGKYEYSESVTTNFFDIKAKSAAETIYINNNKYVSDSLGSTFTIDKNSPRIVRIIAQDGVKEPVIYTLRIASTAEELSTNLSGLMAVAYAESYYPARVSETQFKLDVPYYVSSISLIARAVQGTTVIIGDQETAANSPSDLIVLNPGANTVVIKVLKDNVIEELSLLIVREANPGTVVGKKIAVSFSLLGDSKHGTGAHTAFEKWIDSKPVTVAAGATVKDVFEKMLEEHNIPYTITSGGNYISSINGLAEFDNGKYSGWMYTVNGKHPALGLREYSLQDGDVIVWHYTDDFRLEEGSEPWSNENFGPVQPSSPAGTETKESIAEVTASKRENGVAGATIVGTQLEKFLAELKKLKDDPAVSAVIQIEVPEGSTGFSMLLPQELLAAFEGKEHTTLAVNTGAGSFRLDAKAISAIVNAGAGQGVELSMSQLKFSDLTDKQQALVGNHPIFELAITVGENRVTTFGGGQIGVFLPYVTKSGENSALLTVFYLADNGDLIEMTNAVYDEKNGGIQFNTEHFSKFAVVYERSSFSDVSDSHWAKPYIDQLVSKGIMEGTEDRKFAPEKEVTRAEFAAMLFRMSGDVMPMADSAFADVALNSWYAPYVTWVSKSGVANGREDQLFAPNDSISRQDLATMLARFLKYGGIQLTAAQPKEGFVDHDQISVYAQESVYTLQQAGVIAGKGNGVFDPSANASRAEAAKMIGMIIKYLK
ncbi:S-layer homology domain-containing protein [Paenibacillus koleovorans]|uniref:S-layer homology domain-containing protein n=1 Tax=Paenibacillus koleovorans TaxID=121608 RepID=UPI000FD9AF33|nr:S-layer homology domain-containing protein [Paenibacillus koleovorans]